jgi:hypothetical protein
LLRDHELTPATKHLLLERQSAGHLSIIRWSDGAAPIRLTLCTRRSIGITEPIHHNNRIEIQSFKWPLWPWYTKPLIGFASTLT